MDARKGITFSLAQAWTSNKEKRPFRDRYFLGKPIPPNPAMAFGSHIHNLIQHEPDHPLIAHVPKYTNRDHEYEIDLYGVRVVAHIDGLEPSPLLGLDYKTSEVPWTQEDADKWKQGAVYDMIVEELYGAPCERWDVVNLLTRRVMKDVTFEGHVISTEEAYELTGEVRVLERKVSKEERYRAKEYLLGAYWEIKNDWGKNV